MIDNDLKKKNGVSGIFFFSVLQMDFCLWELFQLFLILFSLSNLEVYCWDICLKVFLYGYYYYYYYFFFFGGSALYKNELVSLISNNSIRWRLEIIPLQNLTVVTSWYRII
jgi:hypothetical protein